MIRRASLLIAVSLVTGAAPSDACADQADALARIYVDAIRNINEKHARSPGKTREDDLAKRLPRQAKGALSKLLEQEGSPSVSEALLRCGEAALDLDLTEDFAGIRERLEEVSPEQARKLGTALSRPRFLLRGLGGLDRPYLERFAEVMEAVLGAYDEVFGFEEWSKVPGKKLRVRVHLEDRITRPPHFAPQFPYHSEVDFPVADAKAFESPTPDGKFLFYGLCHELGHVVAMWGSRKVQEDHHAWAHYTGVVIVEHLSRTANDRPFMKGLRDVRWRSLEKERKRLEDHPPSLTDYDGVLSLLIILHDRVGPRAIGKALNLLDRQDRRLRINRVRYYTFKELRAGLLSTLKGRKAKRLVAKLIPE